MQENTNQSDFSRPTKSPREMQKSETRNAIATQPRKNKGGNFQVVEFEAMREEAAGNENEPSEKHTLHRRCSYVQPVEN